MKNTNHLTLRMLNAVAWTILALVLMTTAYTEWSKYGDYTLFSFFSSLFIHGGICLALGILIDNKLKKDE